MPDNIINITEGKTMTRTFSTPEQRADALRKLAAMQGGKKGSYSQAMQEAGVGTNWLESAYPEMSGKTIVEAMQNGLLPVDDVIAKVEESRRKKNAGGGYEPRQAERACGNLGGHGYHAYAPALGLAGICLQRKAG